jgi:hypothetical protein
MKLIKIQLLLPLALLFNGAQADNVDKQLDPLGLPVKETPYQIYMRNQLEPPKSQSSSTSYSGGQPNMGQVQQAYPQQNMQPYSNQMQSTYPYSVPPMYQQSVPYPYLYPYRPVSPAAVIVDKLLK